MPRTLAPGRTDGRTTDHSDEIHRLRQYVVSTGGSGATYSMMRRRAVIELLEKHDSTLISLDDMPVCAELVNRTLLDAGGMGPFLPNGA